MVENDRTPRLRFKGFTDNWEQYKFVDIYKYASEGGTPDTNNAGFYLNGDIPFVKIEDTETKYIVSAKNHITRDGMEHSSAWMVPENSIIFTNGATVGNVSINRIPVATKQGILGIILTNEIDNEFCYYLLSSRRFQEEVRNRMVIGTFATVILKNLNGIPIFIAKTDEQKFIARFIGKIDELIQLKQSKYEKIIGIKKSLLDNMFPTDGESVPRIRFKGYTNNWKRCKLGETVQIIMGQSPDGNTYSNTESDYILVQGNADLKDGWVAPRNWTTQKTKTAEAGDLIMSVRAPAGSMGKTAYDVVIGRGVAAIKGNEFIYQSLVKMDYDGFWGGFSCGSTFDSINSADIYEAEISCPAEEEQDAIGDFFLKFDNLIALQKQEVEKLKSIKSALLEKMFVWGDGG